MLLTDNDDDDDDDEDKDYMPTSPHVDDGIANRTVTRNDVISTATSKQ